MENILIINGPNLNLLGTREPEIYGSIPMEQVIKGLEEGFPHIHIQYFQSNHEGELIDRIQKCDYEALVINPAAFSHYSIAMVDVLRNLSCPKVEVHISNICAREEYRQKSITAAACDAVISGMGVYGYRAAIDFLLK